MNADTMRKKLGPVADDIAMFLSGIDGFPHDLRDFPTIWAGTWMGVTGFKIPSHLLPHSFDKHINNMLWHDSFDLGIRGFLVVQWMVQPLVETGSTGFHGSGQVPILACGAGGGDILFIPFILFIFRVLNSPLPSAMRAWRIATEVIPVSASIARFDDIVVLVRALGTWRRFIRGIILIAVAGDAGFLFDRYPLMFTCQTGRTSHLGFPPCILACRGFRGFRGFTGFKVAKVHVTTGAGFRGFGEVAVCAGPAVRFFFVHFRRMYFLMVSITHRVNRASAHRATAPHVRMSVILTNSVMVSRLV